MSNQVLIMSKRTKQVTKPVMSLKFKDGHELRVWVLDVGQYAHLAGDRRDFQFYATKSGSLIYEQISTAGHYATEYHLDNQSTWEWIQKWMEAGYKAEGLM